MLMHISYTLFCLFMLTKQFYLLESGSFQVGDGFLALSVFAFGIWYLTKGRKERTFWEVFWKKDVLFAVFVACTCVINGIYYVIYRDSLLIRSSMFLIYNLAAILVFRSFIQEERYLRGIQIILRANIYIQLAMLVTGIGSYRFEHRWCGTFNDPNQMAFFLMMCLFISFCISEMKGKHHKSEWLDWMIFVVLLVLSKSVGMTVGLGVFAIGYMVYIIAKKLASMKGNPKLEKQRKRLLLAIGGGCALAVVLVAVAIVIQYRSGDEYSLFVRIGEKFEILFSGNLKSILAERGLDKILAKPLAFLYGAGDGAFDRYGSGYTQLELHCTPIALWFCYGIVPFGILCIWIRNNIYGLPVVAYLIYGAVFAESLFLVNHRQPLFWMLIILGMAWREVRRQQTTGQKDGGRMPIESSGS